MMKSLTQYISEHKTATQHPVFKCSQTNKEINFDDIIEYSVSDKQELKWLFDRLADGEFRDYTIRLAHWALGNVLIVDTEQQYHFVEDHIVNDDDERDMYDLNTLQNHTDIDGIVLMKK